MKTTSALAITLLTFIAASASAAQVTFDWATVGNAGNADDTHGDGFGGVDYVYRISKHEVTNAQYTDFLNAVDPTGANALALFNGNMAGNFGGIENTGVTDGARYVAQAGREQNPVTFVSFFDAMRFTNWLHNGQGAGDTEAGAYTIGSGGDEVRSVSAKYWIPSEDEWYKAAYYDPSGVYYDYPTGTDTVPYSDNPGSLNTPDDTNVANFDKNDFVVNGYNDGFAVSGSTIFPSTTNPFTDVGAYSLATSPYGTYDQGGNVWEWNEAVFGSSFRGLRGGSWNSFSGDLRTDSGSDGNASVERELIGFRVATVPEPSTMLMGALAGVGLLLRRRR